MRPLAFKLLNVALTVILLLSFSLSAFALPYRNWLVIQGDEQPWPAVVSSSTHFIVLKSTYGFILIPVSVKSSKVSDIIQDKPGSSSGKNETLQ